MTFTKLVNDIISDGKWHSISEIYEITQHLITPERAIRRALYRSSLLSDIDKSVRKGKWIAVKSLLDTHARRKQVESRGIGVDREFRLLNGFPSLGN